MKFYQNAKDLVITPLACSDYPCFTLLDILSSEILIIVQKPELDLNCYKKISQSKNCCHFTPILHNVIVSVTLLLNQPSNHGRFIFVPIVIPKGQGMTLLGSNSINEISRETLESFFYIKKLFLKIY